MVNLSDPQAFIALPIGPYDLSLRRSMTASAECSTIPLSLHKPSTGDRIANARAFVWGVDDGEIDVSGTWIGANPDRIILSKEQQEAGIDAARGLGSGLSDQ